MSENLYKETGTFTPDSLIASNDFPLIAAGIELAKGYGELKRGAALGKDTDGFYHPTGKILVTTPGTAGVYTLTVGTAFVNNDTVSIDDVDITCKTTPTAGQMEIAPGTASVEAAAIAALIAASFPAFNVTASGATVVFTQKVNGTGTIPTVENGAGNTGSATIATTTSGVADVTRTVGADGILTDTVDTGNTYSASEGIISTQYVAGHFSEDAISLPTGVTLDTYKSDFRKLGIYFAAVQEY